MAPGNKHLRENESITIDPVGVLGVESHEFVEKDVGNRCHTHGRTGMPGVGCEGGIDLHTRSNQYCSGSLFSIAPDESIWGGQSK